MFPFVGSFGILSVAVVLAVVSSSLEYVPRLYQDVKSPENYKIYHLILASPNFHRLVY